MAKRKKRSQKRGSAGRSRPRWRTRVLRVVLLLALVSGGVGALLWNQCGISGCPDPDALVAYRPGGAPVLLDRNENVLTSLHPLERNVVSLDSLPEHVPAAFVAVEDRRFWNHPGIDPIRVLGAALHNLRRPGERQGASTITMQLARSVFPDRLPRTERTMRRKLLEARVALSIEQAFSKEAILELYLNHVYFGAGTHGIEAASRYYFDRPASELDVAEAALLAGMVRTPARTDPRRAPERALARRGVVLSLMEAEGIIPAATAEEARSRPLGVSPDPPSMEPPGPAPYFVETVRLELEQALGAGAYTAGLRVHTTLDPTAQGAAESALSERLAEIEAGAFGPYPGPVFDPSTPAGPEGTDYLQGAVVVMDHASGEVLALVGGRDFAHSRFNRAIHGRRPVGSAFKPFVVLAALRGGFAASQPVADRPFELTQAGAAPWTPRNYDRAYLGRVALRESLVRSLNVPIARLALATGVEPIVQVARDLGVTDSIPATPALALGTAELSPLELTAAYAGLASQGHPRSPRFIRHVEDERGRLVYRSGPDPDPQAPPPEPAIDPRLTFLVTDMLEDAVTRGTGTGVRAGGYSGLAAGKTGTTPEGADTWFVGYTPRVVASVWIGHDRPRAILPGASGGRLAAPIWGRAMEALGAGADEAEGWSRPEGLVERSVDPETGLVLADGCRLDGRSPVQELFLEEAVPETACPERPGFFSRLAGTVRGWFGGEEGEDGSGPGSEAMSVQRLEPADDDALLLGAEPLRLAPR